MIELNFTAEVVSTETKTTNAGSEFLVAILKHSGEAFGRPVDTMVEVTVPASMKETFPPVGSKGKAKVYMTSREWNGRHFNSFRLNGFEVTSTAQPSPENAVALDALDSFGDEIPFNQVVSR